MGYMSREPFLSSTYNDTRSYEPFKPSSFICQPAAALIFSKGGEVEVISQKCSARINTFPKFAGIGQTISLLDDELLILGNDDLGAKKHYISIQRPRDGLLAMKYTVQDFPLTQSPHEHSSLVSGNTLTVLGGKFKSRGKLSKFTWTELPLKWENESKYTPDTVGACTVKLGADVHIMIGGQKAVNNQKVLVSQVVKINTTEEIAYELNPISYRRKSHACQLLNKNTILVSGGISQPASNSSLVQYDELYSISSQEAQVLSLENSLKRAHHAMIRLGERLLAVGGHDHDNNVASKIAEFDKSRNSWTQLDEELQSTDTAEVIVSEYPQSSLDCVSDCQCGISDKKQRIFGGSEAEAI